MTSCADRYDKSFYGVYSYDNGFNVIHSKINFYSTNKYSIYSSSCLDNQNDTGSFVLNMDTIYFNSIKICNGTNAIDNPCRTLTGKKFIYKNDKIYYINNHMIPVDTFCWTKNIK